VAEKAVNYVYSSEYWDLDVGRRELRARGTLVPLGGRAFELLQVLVQAEGRLVGKSELMVAVWPGAVVGENTLQVHINAIRKAFGADRRLLKTTSGRGYRLTGGWSLRLAATQADPADHDADLRTDLACRGNLPSPVSGLIGREAAVHALRDLLSAYRIVTLTGPGGIGKTSLALEVARGLEGSFAGGCWLVELASLSDPDLVPSALAGALGLERGGDKISPSVIAQAIGRARLLIVLDNCERVIESAAQLTDAVMRTCPNVFVIATTREPLQVAGERLYRVPPLDFPAPQDAEAEQADILGHSAVQLFITRMKALVDETPRNSRTLMAIAAICRRLDGIPLAIELAAARAAILRPEDIVSRLDDRFGLLVSGRRTALPRHRTLLATHDWSYELLSQHERLILQRLAIFACSFSLEAAIAVARDDDIELPQFIDQIANLAAKSLLTIDRSRPVILYRLLETTRAYSLDKLAASGALRQISRRHAEYLCDLLVKIADEREMRPPLEFREDDRRRTDEVRAALDWAFSSSGDVSIGVALTVAAVPLWFARSLMSEARDRLEQALQRGKASSSHDAQREMQLSVALAEALLHVRGVMPETAAVAVQALHLADNISGSDHQLRALWVLFVYRLSENNYRAALILAQRFWRIAATQAEALELPIGDRMVGIALHYLGEQSEALSCIQRTLDRYIVPIAGSHRVRLQLDQRIVARVFMARVLWLRGFPERAMAIAQSAAEEARVLDHGTSLCHALSLAACPIAFLTGDLAAAERSLTMLIDSAVRHRLPLWNAWSQCHRASLLIRFGDTTNGIQLLRSELIGLRERPSIQMPSLTLLGELAQGLGQIGEINQALEAINEALDKCEQSEERWYIAELLRIKGNLTLLGGEASAVAHANALFSESLSWAQRQTALSWELRTSISLAHLQHNLGMRREARALVASVYRRFTEGFETADLLTAKRFLDETA
jgi:predicted ATPase/DNA-binding winged helix-turn-helix (wHTH) protein